jgi:hypothetical protein
MPDNFTGSPPGAESAGGAHEKSKMSLSFTCSPPPFEQPDYSSFKAPTIPFDGKVSFRAETRKDE